MARVEASNLLESLDESLPALSRRERRKLEMRARILETARELFSDHVLIFNYANLDDFPIRERGHAAARILADALAPHPEAHRGTT